MGNVPAVVALRGGPRFGVLGLAFVAGSAVTTGVVGASSSARVTIAPPSKTIPANVSLSSKVTVNPVSTQLQKPYAALSSKVTLTPTSQLTKQPFAGISGKTTVTPISVQIKRPYASLSSKVTLTPTSALTKQPVVGISGKATVTPVSVRIQRPYASLSSSVTLTPTSKLTKQPVVGISSKTTISPYGQKSGNPTPDISFSSRVTVTATSQLTKKPTVDISSKVTTTSIPSVIKTPVASISSRVTLQPVGSTVAAKLANVSLSSSVTLVATQKRTVNQSIGLSSYTRVNSISVVNHLLTASISSRVTVNPLVSGGSVLCQCPEWLNLLPTTCGWEVDNLENTVTVGTATYDLPFTLPIFRFHILGTTGGTTTVVQSYNYGNLLSGVYKNPNSTICNTTRPATLVRQFKRKGCM